MKELLEQIRQKARQELAAAEDSKGLEELRVRYLKKGELTAILKQMGGLSAEERPVIGQMANQIRAEIENELKEADAHIRQHMLEKKLASEKLGSYGDIFLALCESGGEIQFYPKDE